MTKEEAERYYYLSHTGKARDGRYKPEQCAYEIYPSEKSLKGHQCEQPPGHGPDGLYCKQHSKMVKG